MGCRGFHNLPISVLELTNNEVDGGSCHWPACKYLLLHGNLVADRRWRYLNILHKKFNPNKRAPAFTIKTIVKKCTHQHHVQGVGVMETEQTPAHTHARTRSSSEGMKYYYRVQGF